MKVLLLAIYFLLLAASAEATTYYVATTGGGSTCSLAAPCGTIAAGVSKLASGDTLLIRGGTYAESIVGANVPSGGGSWATATTVAAYPGNCYTAGVYGPGGSCETVNIQTLGVYNSAKSWIIFDGFHINGTGNFEVVAFGSNLGNAYRPTYIKLANSEITGGDHDGINSGADYGGSNSWYFNLKVHDNATGGTPGQDHGIYLSGSNNIVENSDIYNNCAYGIQINDSFAHQANTNIIRNNRLHANGTCGAGAGGMVFAQGNTNLAYNNLSYGNTGDGFVVYGDGALYYNNTAYGNSGYGINIAAGLNTVLRNNIVYSNGGTINNSGTNTTQEYNVTADPSFQNAAGNDFRLTAKSTNVIDQGMDLSVVFTTDFGATPRPQGKAFDVGAYEYASPVTITVAVTGANPACPGFSACTVTTTPIVFSGTTTAATAGQVTFSTDRGSSGNATWSPGSGWTTSSIALKPGINIVTISSTDASGNLGTATVTVTYAPSFPGNALVAGWGFEEVSGGTVNDQTANKNNGTLVNATRTGGRYGQGIAFNGTNQYITVPSATSLNMTQSFTLSAWVKPTGAVKTDYRAIIHKNSLPLNSPYELYASVGGYCGAGGVDGAANTNGSSGPYYHACSVTPLQVNVWTFVAVTYDGSNLKLYRSDTNQLTAVAVTTAATGYLESSTDTLQIGATEYGEYFEGVLDEVRVYNVALSLASANNKVFGATCNVEEYTVATASIIGDANCPVVPATPPPTFKVGAAAAALKIGASTVFKVGQSP